MVRRIFWLVWDEELNNNDFDDTSSKEIHSNSLMKNKFIDEIYLDPENSSIIDFSPDSIKLLVEMLNFDKDGELLEFIGAKEDQKFDQVIEMLNEKLEVNNIDESLVQEILDFIQIDPDILLISEFWSKIDEIKH